MLMLVQTLNKLQSYNRLLTNAPPCDSIILLKASLTSRGKLLNVSCSGDIEAGATDGVVCPTTGLGAKVGLGVTGGVTGGNVRAGLGVTIDGKTAGATVTGDVCAGCDITG